MNLDSEHRFPYYALYTNKGKVVKHIHFQLESENELLQDSGNRLFGMLITLTAPPVTEIDCELIVNSVNQNVRGFPF